MGGRKCCARKKEMATKTQINDTQLRQIARFHVGAILFEVCEQESERERERVRVPAEVLRVGGEAGIELHDISFFWLLLLFVCALVVFLLFFLHILLPGCSQQFACCCCCRFLCTNFFPAAAFCLPACRSQMTLSSRRSWQISLSLSLPLSFSRSVAVAVIITKRSTLWQIVSTSRFYATPFVCLPPPSLAYLKMLFLFLFAFGMARFHLCLVLSLLLIIGKFEQWKTDFTAFIFPFSLIINVPVTSTIRIPPHHDKHHQYDPLVSQCLT